MTVVAPILIGLAYVCLNAALPEPTRRRVNAIMVAGAGAAYLGGGGLGPWEIVFTAVATYCAYRVIAVWCLAGGPAVVGSASVLTRPFGTRSGRSRLP